VKRLRESQAGQIRSAVEGGVERLERATARLARLSWVTLAASVIELLSSDEPYCCAAFY
jgi:hypothetical protein